MRLQRVPRSTSMGAMKEMRSEKLLAWKTSFIYFTLFQAPQERSINRDLNQDKGRVKAKDSNRRQSFLGHFRLFLTQA